MLLYLYQGKVLPFRFLQRGSRRRFISKRADYVVVGAGSAGCVIATRLAEAGFSVNLLEAGNWSPLRGPMSIFCRMPTALSIPMHFDQFNWKYQARPSNRLANRVISTPRGKGVGGSSSINGMVYVRGHPMDYETWANEHGAEGWSWTDVAGYFKKMENYNGPIEEGCDLRGTQGPLHVKVGKNAIKTPLYDAFIQAGQSAGYGSPLCGDYNGSRQEGFGAMPATIFHDESHPRFGERCSAAAAYLQPFLALEQNKATKCLQVITGATVEQILFDQVFSQMNRAIGVRCQDGRTFFANKEIILCSGAIATPILLQASGIGDFLTFSSQQKHILHLPGVGKNLQDHLEFYLQFEVGAPVSIAPWLSPLKRIQIGFDWLLGRSSVAGALASTNHFEAGAFIRSSAHVAYPDIQFHFLPVAISYDGVTQPASNFGHTFQLHVGHNRSRTRGTVRLEPDGKTPIIDFDYMAHLDDWTEMRRALRLAREVISHMDLPHITELQPGPQTVEAAAIDAFLQQHLESAYHPCGTAKMGTSSDPNTVCNSQAQVLGLQNLRVCDASLMPSIINGNLNAVCIMMAEKIADSILGNSPPPTPKSARLAPQGWIDPQWKSRQRLNPPEYASTTADIQTSATGADSCYFFQHHQRGPLALHHRYRPSS